MGLPTYGTPRPGSVGVKMENQCAYSTDCRLASLVIPNMGVCEAVAVMCFSALRPSWRLPEALKWAPSSPAPPTLPAE